MTLKQLIYKRLKSRSDLTGKLATYAGSAAIFDTEAPEDQQDGWDEKQYPRCDYIIDMQANEERSSVGTLAVTVYTERTSMIILALTAAIKDAFRDILLLPDDGGPYSFAWANTNGFTIPGQNIIGQTITFDIVEYPDQQTTDPDPQIALAKYLKEFYPECIVLGMDRIGEITDAADKPILYVEVTNITKTSWFCMNTIAWMDCRMTVHLLCPDPSVKQKMCVAIQQKLANDEQVMMLDNSLMRINGVVYDGSADYLRNGQLIINARYGILKNNFKPHTIIHIQSEEVTHGN